MAHEKSFSITTDHDYTQAEIDELNIEFERRYDGETVQEHRMFLYNDGRIMSRKDAVKAFRHEVEQR